MPSMQAGTFQQGGSIHHVSHFRCRVTHDLDQFPQPEYAILVNEDIQVRRQGPAGRGVAPADALWQRPARACAAGEAW